MTTNQSNRWKRFSKLLGFDAGKALHAVSWLFSTQAIASGAGFVLTVILANLLTETEFGTYKYLMTLAGVVGIIALSGLGSSTTRSVARGYEGEVWQATLTRLKWSGGMVLLALSIAGYYLYMGNETLGYGALAICVATPLTGAFSLFSSYLNGKEKYRTLSIFGVIYTVLPPVVTVLTLLFVSKNILVLFLAFIVSQMLAAIALYYTTFLLYPPNKLHTTEGINYGKHLSLMNILGNLSLQMDKLLTWHILGPVQLAVYAVVSSPPQQLRYFNKIINTLSIPKYSRQSMRAIRQTVVKKSVILFGFGLLLVIPYWLLAPWLFDLVFPKYVEYVIYSQVFSLVILFFPVILIQGVLTAKRQIKALYWIQTVFPIVKILLLFITLPLFGLWGIFITLFTLETSRLFLSTFFFLRIPLDDDSEAELRDGLAS